MRDPAHCSAFLSHFRSFLCFAFKRNEAQNIRIRLKKTSKMLFFNIQIALNDIDLVVQFLLYIGMSKSYKNLSIKNKENNPQDMEQ